MEEELPEAESTAPAEPEKEHIPEVYTKRDWKEYLGESLLIIFSVILALVLTEYFNSLHEKKETEEILKNIRTELVQNEQNEQLQYAYHLKVLKSIDSVLVNPSLEKKLFVNGEFKLTAIAPRGILYRYLDHVAWDIAKDHNIYSKINFKITSKLTHIYEEQSRVMKVEDAMAPIVLSFDSRKAENARVTLILMRDTYHAWAVDRAEGLLHEYEDAIKLMDEEK